MKTVKENARRYCSMALRSHRGWTFGMIWIASGAWAAGVTDVTRVQLSASPFPACLGVKLLRAVDYEKDTRYWEGRCKSGEEAIQILPKDGALLSDLQRAVKSLSFLQEIGEKAMKRIDEKIRQTQKTLACFQTQPPSAECAALMKREIDSAYSNLDELRLELALSEGKDPSFVGRTRGTSGKLEFPPVSELVNSSLKKGYLGAVGVFRAEDTEPLSPGERHVAEDRMANEIEQLHLQGRDVSRKFQIYQRIRATHKARYLERLQAAPVLTVLGKLPPKNDSEAIRSRFLKAYSELLKATKEERAKMAVALSHASLPGPGVSREKHVQGDRERAKELLSFMAYAPIVDEVIQERVPRDPAVCALASALLQSHEDAEFRSDALKTGTIIAGGVALTALSGGLGSLVLPEMVPLVGGMALSAQTAAALALGPGFGFYTRHAAGKDLAAAKGAVAGGVKNAEAVDKADSAVVAGRLSAGTLDLVGVGFFKAAGGVIFRSLAKNALTSEGVTAREAEKLIAQSRSKDTAAAQKAHARIVDSMKKQATGSSLSARATKALDRKPTPEQLVAVKAAHEVGAGERGLNPKFDAGIGNYTLPQLRKKAEILHQAGFAKPEIRQLMEKGIVGKEGGFWEAFKQTFENNLETRSRHMANGGPTSFYEDVRRFGETPQETRGRHISDHGNPSFYDDFKSTFETPEETRGRHITDHGKPSFYEDVKQTFETPVETRGRHLEDQGRNRTLYENVNRTFESDAETRWRHAEDHGDPSLYEDAHRFLENPLETRGRHVEERAEAERIAEIRRMRDRQHGSSGSSGESARTPSAPRDYRGQDRAGQARGGSSQSGERPMSLAESTDAHYRQTTGWKLDQHKEEDRLYRLAQQPGPEGEKARAEFAEIQAKRMAQNKLVDQALRQINDNRPRLTEEEIRLRNEETQRAKRMFGM